MKKTISILLAIMMLGVFACAASADEVLQPEAGKKFESDWAIPGGLAEIVYEEEGYRVTLEITKDGAGSRWEYSCYYHEDTDSLSSVSSSRLDYTIDPATGDQVPGDYAYEGIDEENQGTEFTIDQDGSPDGQRTDYRSAPVRRQQTSPARPSAGRGSASARRTVPYGYTCQ